MIKVSNSELTCFRDCRRKWWLEYYRKLKPEEKLSGALALGTNVHEALANYYAPGGTKELANALIHTIYEDALNNAGEYELAQLEKDAKLAKIMVEGYFEWLEETGEDSDLEIVEPEAEIHYDTEVSGTPVRIQGKRDVIAVNTKTGINTLIDHKTCVSFNDPALDLNEQSRMYLLLQRLNGSTVVQNCIWNLLRKVQRTARAEPPFYKREDIYVGEQELRYFYERIHGIIRDLIRVREDLDRGESHRTVCYPRPSRDCSWKCSFRVVCPMIDADPHFEEFIRDTYIETDPYERYLDAKGVID